MSDYPNRGRRDLTREEWWERHRAQQRARHALLREARRRGRHTRLEWEERLRQYAGRCAYCARSGATDRDHVIPLARGGSDAIENVVPACRSCNSRKRNSVGVWVPRPPERQHARV